MISVMIVDDEPLVRVSVQTWLTWEDHGFSFVGEASDGREALRILEQHPVDILLLDIHMPRMDGLELLEALKGRKHPPCVIVLSANDHYEYVRKAFQLGAWDYILKSDMDGENLLALLNKVREAGGVGKAPRKELRPREREYMKSMLFLDLFHGRNLGFTRSLLEEMEISLEFPLRICYLWTNSPMDQELNEIVRLQANQFLMRMNETGYALAPGKGDLFFLLREAGGRKASTGAESFCRNFIDVVANSLDIPFDFALSPPCGSPEEIPEQYRYITSLRTIESRMIRRAKRYIRKNFSRSGLNLEEVSTFVEVSKAHLSSQFRKETGMTFRDYLTKVRMDQAEKLLLTSNLKVYQISEKVGYPHVEHFSRLFKKVTGMTPNRYSAGRDN